MASTKIRGITIELGGDTSGLKTAFAQLDRSINGTKSELKDVERLLKLDPGNVDLLNQKQTLLNKSIETYSQRLNSLKSAQEGFDASLYSSAEEAQRAQNALQREIVSTTQRLEDAQKAARDLGAAGAEASVNLEKIGTAAQTVADKTAGLSKAAQGMLGAVGAAVAGSVSQFADFQQNIGGIETFFKENTDVVKEYANEAFKTAGLSANAYMETVTGFSAALLSSLGGNTRAAAELANIAIIDMADNANKFGTDIASIQSAYQGFAKQNYNMLDNLKLGFAGNKEGMQQLLAEAERLTGVKFDISSFADIVTAIHEVQKSMGIAGTTATEAESTITGSLNTLKASLANLALGFADADADVDKLAQDSKEAFAQVYENIAPVVDQVFKSLPGWAQLGLGITAVTAVVSPAASAIANLTTIFSRINTLLPTVKTALDAANISLAGFTATSAGTVGVVLAIVAAVAALIAALNKLRESKANELGLDIKAMPMNSDYGVQGLNVSQNEYLKRQKLPGFANGGTLTSGSAIVGELAPELLTVSGGRATVTPITNNNITNNYGPQGGGSVPVDVTLMLDRAVLARLMVDPNARAVTLAGESAIH